MNEALTIEQGRPVVRIQRALRHPVEKVWKSITDPSQLGAWYPFAVASMDFRVGGAIRFDDGEGTTFPATILEIDPPRVFAFSESPPEVMTRETADLIRIELAETDEGCLLTFSHTFTDLPAAASYTTGWIGCLDALELRLAGSDTLPELDWVAVYEHWIEAFGLDHGESTVEDGEATIRFERQLMRQPRDKAWQVITADSPLDVGDGVPDLLLPGAESAAVLTSVSPAAAIGFTLDGARVLWNFSDGPGGVRIELTVTGEGGDEALTRWRACVEGLVSRIVAADPAATL